MGEQEAFRSLTLLVAICEQALFELEAAHVKLSGDLAAKIEATRDACARASPPAALTPVGVVPGFVPI